jgi:hypothetical protein
MATSFTTTVTQMYTLPQEAGETDVVVTAMYTVTGVDGEYVASIGGSQQFTISADDPGFTPYDQLTQAQVIGWIPESAITSCQACVQGQINSMITPPVSPTSQPLPWIPA